MSEIVVVQTGVANTASILAALKRAGGTPVLSRDRDRIAEARQVVLPGVGAFDAGMKTLRDMQLVDVLRARAAENKAMLAICLGMQLLASESEEAPNVPGLAILSSKIERFSKTVRVPQFGWNLVTPSEESSYLEPGFAYFANSYCLRSVADDWQTTQAEYDSSFIAAIEKGNILACQFHPELSGTWGTALLKRWVSATC